MTISRSGYTGEDGFEISVEDAIAGAFGKLLVKDRCAADRPRRS